MTWADHDKRTLTDKQWQQLRKATLRRDKSLCRLMYAPCEGKATHVDHIEPVYLRPELQGEMSNLQAACKPCHDIKSRAEAIDGAKRARAKAKLPEELHPGLL